MISGKIRIIGMLKLASHARGRWFESSNLHLKTPLLINVFRNGVFLLLSFTHNLLYHILPPFLRAFVNCES